MSDLISRQDAIKELESGKDKKAKGEIGGFYNQIIENGIEKLRELPSAQPKVKCIANVTLTDEQVKEAFEKAKCEILDAQPEPKRGRWIEEVKKWLDPDIDNELALERIRSIIYETENET